MVQPGSAFTRCECMCTQEPGKAKKVDAVTLSTIHKAKGLEWDVVVLRACNRGQLPMEFKPPNWGYPSPAVPLGAPFVPPNHSVRLKCWLYSRLTRLYTRHAIPLRARRSTPCQAVCRCVLLAAAFCIELCQPLSGLLIPVLALACASAGGEIVPCRQSDMQGASCISALLACVVPTSPRAQYTHCMQKAEYQLMAIPGRSMPQRCKTVHAHYISMLRMISRLLQLLYSQQAPCSSSGSISAMAGLVQVSQQEFLHAAEEHRLAYLGMTRARKLLYLTCHRWRQAGDDGGRKEVFPAHFFRRLFGSPHCVVKGEDDGS